MLLPLHINLRPMMRAGGGIGDNFWLRWIEESPAPKKAKALIRKVAKEEAAKQLPFKLAPVREAFQAIAYPFKNDYYEIYRNAYKAELSRLRAEEEDEEDSILVLLH